ncbi:preprotein translocase subunit SecA [Ramlibacter sp. USB13]|uniref:Protein translocase subunit SecA n=1 Tax=Ramlibacter cellulosilyticus TaxID=2764187 RepID=A0A923SB91_9BURK|nr:helicase-related protein [Ramlibacter cellulosilyticus]MBC5782983.1 preprotein translocase subunit SecA [Ramlibacter cellulosilyticus]
MAMVGALVKGKGITVGDGVYLERKDVRELAAEAWLRGALARLPALPRRGMPWDAVVRAAGRHEAAVQALDDAALRADFRAQCARMAKEGFTDVLLARAFAGAREASRRALGKRHHDVQLMGGWTLLHGYVGEMATGEGKTITAGLAASVGAATGAAVHVVTVNDYLAQRDAEENRALFDFLGLSVGVIQGDMEPDTRRAQYARDITYVSNKELVFDYLKDRIATKGTLDAHVRLRAYATGAARLPVLLRGLHLAIIDEADSVLIDEARTPLIISETLPDELGAELYQQAIAFARRMREGEHFEHKGGQQLYLNAAAEADMTEWTVGLPGVWRSAVWRRELIHKALSALHCFHRDQHYIIAEDKVQIVDEFTGRVMPDRSWERGLHQMIEAKEGAEITGQRKTLSQMTYQRFFRRYLLLGGMTGTAREIAAELKGTYDLEVLPVPTHKPGRRLRLRDACHATDDARWAAVAARAAELAAAGRAVLVGTRSVQASEILDRLLEDEGVPHTVLNARQDQAEAEAVAQAGGRGRITVATNMAGRGTDIKPEADVLASGGLHVILTEFHESARVDRQLFGRSARQGQPGTVEAIVCVDDEVFVRFGQPLQAVARAVARRSGRLPAWLLKLLARYTQARAEAHNRRVRMQTLKHDRRTGERMGFTGKSD